MKLDLLKGPIHFLLLKLTCYKRRWSTLEIYFCNQYQTFVKRKMNSTNSDIISQIEIQSLNFK